MTKAKEAYLISIANSEMPHGRYMTKTQKVYLISISILIAILISSFAIWLNGELVRMKSDDVNYDYSELRNIFEKQGWPRDFEKDFWSNKGGLIIDDHSGLKYLCTTRKNIYFYIPEKKVLRKILVMQPKPYRTNIWPFGKEQNTVMYSHEETKRIGSRNVDPKNIIELIPEQKVKYSRQEGF